MPSRTARTSVTYADCKDIPRTRPTEEVDEELIKEVSNNFRTLPSFEKTVFERKWIKHYSLERNELLKCRWKICKENSIEKAVREPFQFPSNRDLHFFNQCVQYVPEMSTYRWKDVKRTLGLGPGVDHLGLMRPAPYDVFMKRMTNDEGRNVEGRKDEGQKGERKADKREKKIERKKEENH